MAQKEIIDKASRIVCAYLEAVESSGESQIKVSKRDLVEVFSALAIAGQLCRVNAEEK